MKKAFLFGIIAFSLIGIVVIVYAVGTQTITKSDASSCQTPPKMVLESTNKYEAMTIYNLKLINTCDSAEKFMIKVAKFPNSPEKHDNWTWKFKDSEWDTALITAPLTGTSDITLTIQQPVDSEGLPKNIEKGIYQFFEIETELEKGRTEKDKLDLIYSVK